MTSGPITKSLLIFAFPMMAGKFSFREAQSRHFGEDSI